MPTSSGTSTSRTADYDLYNARYVVAPKAQAIAGLPDADRWRPAQVHPVPGADERLRQVRRDRVTAGGRDQERPVPRGSPGNGSVARRASIPALHPVRLSGHGGRGRVHHPCPVARTEAGRPSRLFHPGRFNLVVACPADSHADHQDDVPPELARRRRRRRTCRRSWSRRRTSGSRCRPAHTRSMRLYEATPIKTPLLILGLITLVGLMVLRGRLDRTPVRRRREPESSA